CTRVLGGVAAGPAEASGAAPSGELGRPDEIAEQRRDDLALAERRAPAQGASTRHAEAGLGGIGGPAGRAGDHSTHGTAIHEAYRAVSPLAGRRRSTTSALLVARERHLRRLLDPGGELTGVDLVARLELDAARRLAHADGRRGRLRLEVGAADEHHRHVAPEIPRG